jgi:His-Xaa-Ser system protein HxsD
LNLEVDEKLFPRVVTLAAAHRFLERCYVRLEMTGPKRLQVVLRAKAGTPATRSESLRGEFENELLHQAMRQQVATQTESMRELLVGRALLAAEPSPDALPPGADPLADPLGIAIPWDEKYGGSRKEN